MQYFFSTIRLTFKNTFAKLSEIVDDRGVKEKIYFPFEVIFIYAIFIFILDVRSKNSIKKSLNKELIIKSINKYFGINPGKCPCGAEIEKVFKKISANELQNFF